MKIRILSQKRVISVEVQAEGSRQLQPSSRTSPRTLPSLILQLEPLYISPLVVCGSGMDERMVNGGMPFGGVRGAPFIAQGGRFPPEINMETLGTAFRRIGSIFLPKMRLKPPTWGRPTLWFGRPTGVTSQAAFHPGHY